MRFEYQSPYQSFQRSTVCGKLCTLFRIKDPQKFAVSLKEVIGGRVANVVVEKSQTASEILKAKVLRERVTFMPIDKMQVRSVDPDKLRQIHQLTGGAAKLAIELIEFDRKYEPVMVQVFGSTFVCEDQETAKKICYNRDFGFVCVTLEGDKYEPAGGLHGGSMAQGSNLLLKVDAFLKSEEQRRAKEQELFKEKKELETLSEQQSKTRAISDSKENLERKLYMLNNQVGGL